MCINKFIHFYKIRSKIIGYARSFVLIILLYSVSCYASFWDGLSQCLSNPCNCGYGTEYEWWNGKRYDKGDENPLCPPYNKGRDDNTCIVQFDYPGIYTPWYLQYCAESTSESNYFAPKIRVRYQACNSAVCWTNSTILNWDGDCVNWPTAYAIPLLRVCARIALPAMPGELGADPTPADPGYTVGHHLNSQGAVEEDSQFIGDDNTPIMLIKPKLCAYKDPSLIDTVTTIGALGIDLMDYNPDNQPLHNTGGLHPIAKILIFLAGSSSSNNKSLTDMVGTLLDSIGDTVVPGLDLFKTIFDAIGAMIQYTGNIFIAILKEFGQFNRVVDSYNFGCVEIPIGPYPPPYCPKLAPFIPSPSTNAICEIGGVDADGNNIVISSTTDHKCVVSNLVNNFIRNSIRITFDNFVPLCKNGEDPTVTDKCVTIPGTFTGSAIGVHTASAFRDIIPACSKNQNSFCVKTMINTPPCSMLSINSWCAPGFRIAYGSRTGSTSIPSNYFLNDLVGCDQNSGSTCQEVWGVNTGSFIDISLIFPQIERYTTTPLVYNSSLPDTNNNKRNFYAAIRRQSTTITDMPGWASTFQQDSKQICVFGEANDLIGCENRIPMKPKVDISCKTTINTGFFVCQNDGSPCTSATGAQYQNTIDYQSISTAVCANIMNDSNTKMLSCPSTTQVMCRATADDPCANAGSFCISASGTVVSCQSNSTNVCTALGLRCVTSAGTTVSCNGIPSAPKIYACSDPQVKSLGLSCTNDYFLPAFVAALQSGNDITAAVIEPLSVNNDNSIRNYKVNLAGYDFISNVTDENFTQKPFSGPHSINPLSIYGTYKPGPIDNVAAPYAIQSDGSIKTTDGIYLTGLEYVGGNDINIFDGKYIEGGSYTCLQTSSLDRCSAANTTNCVLTNLLNRDTVNCKDFATKLSKYNNLHLCTSADGSYCMLTDSLPAKKDGNGITINDCGNNNYCYTNDQNPDSAVCVISLQNQDRYYPAPNTGAVMTLQDSQYYDLNGTPGAGYDKNMYAIRDKTPVELGLCTTIPKPTCKAITKPSANDGAATWPETAVGTQATGRCQAGYSALNPPRRYCVANAYSMTVAFEKLDQNNSCFEGDIAFTNTHNFPSPYPPERRTKNSYSFGIDQNNTLQLQLATTYTSTLQFNITDVSKIDYFLVTLDYSGVIQEVSLQSAKGTFAIVTQNYSSPGFFQNTSFGITTANGLQNGLNTLTFNFQARDATGAAGFYYLIQYQLKN